MEIKNGVMSTGGITDVSGDVTLIKSYTDTEVAAIKLKTDNLPLSPCATGDVANALVVDVPDVVTNNNVIQAVGNKADAAVVVVGITKSVIAYVKGILTNLNLVKVETDKIPAEIIKTAALNTNLGTLLDEDDTDTICGRTYILKKHFHGRARSYPFLGAGVTLTGNATANLLGAFVEIVPVLANEINTLTINSACTADGFVTIDLDGVKHTVVVSIGTANEVAEQLRGYIWNTCECGTWTITGTDAEVIFTRGGLSTTGVLSNLGATGVTGTFVKTQTGAGIVQPFDIHVIQGGIASAKDTYNIVLYKGLTGYEERVGGVRVSTEAANSATGMIPFMSEILPSGTRISAQLASGTGGSDTLVISINYHVY